MSDFNHGELLELDRKETFVKSKISRKKWTSLKSWGEGLKFVFDDSTLNLSNVFLGNLFKSEGNEKKQKVQLGEIVFETRQENLKYLDASNCQIEHITIKNCPHLQALYLPGNGLKSITFEEDCPNLRLLDVSNNLLNRLELPFTFSSLRYLYLYRNKLNDLSNLAGFFTREGFDFNIGENEELTAPAIEIVKQGKPAVINWFEQTRKQGTDYIYEAKMLIVGEGESGKTTLACKIGNPDCALPKVDDRTRGISILPHYFKVNPRKDIGKQSVNFRLNVWDFGGQEIYHATHRFFLSKRSLYVLVSDNRKDNTHFDYWLDIVRLFAGDCPMLVVLNEKDDVKNTKDMVNIRSRFGNIKDIVELNFKTFEEKDSFKKSARLEKIKQLIEIIEMHGSQLPHIGDAVPARWVDVRKAIESEKRNYIDLKEFQEMCGKHGIDKKEDIGVLSGYFHDIGVLLHFQDIALLKRTVILHPAWATNAVYKIFDHEKIKEKTGRFTKQDVCAIWCEADYCDMHDELLELMHQFRLVYPIKGTDKLVAPEMLPNDTPEYTWNSVRNLQLRYRYEVFMPKGILSQAIVELHKYITNNALVWKSGVILEREGTLAEVTVKPHLPQIFIRLRGNDVKGLLAIITDTFDEINQTYHGLKVDKFVPCICDTCQALDEPHFHRLAELQKRKAFGKLTIECSFEPFLEIKVQDLLDTVENENHNRNPDKTMGTTRNKVFISYAHQDKKYLEEVQKHLNVLKKIKIDIEIWDDTKIDAGMVWRDEIRKNLEAVKVAILLVSTDFLNSDFIKNIEIPAFLKAAENKGATIIPLILRPSIFKEVEEISQFHAIHNPDEPLSSCNENKQEEILVKLAKTVKDLMIK